MDLPIDWLAGHWYVLHTRSRQEKALAADLARLNVPYFLPLVRVRRTYGGRIRRVELPLFPGYLFFCGAQRERQAVVKTNRVAQVLDAPDQVQLITDLQQIYRVVTSDQPVDLYPRLKKGARCRVASGPLTGLEGIVLRRPGPWRVYIGVHFLGQSAEIQIDAALLEIID